MKQGVQKQLQEKVDAKKLNVNIHASQLHTIHLHLYKKNKTVAHIGNGFIIVLFTFTRGNIFVTVLFELSPM